MFNKKMRLFKVSYRDHNNVLTSMLTGADHTIVVARDEKHAVKQFYKRAVHVSDDIIDIEEYEVEKIEQ